MLHYITLLHYVVLRYIMLFDCYIILYKLYLYYKTIK